MDIATTKEFTLWSSLDPDAPGLPLSFDTDWLLLKEAGRYCSLRDVDTLRGTLVCDETIGVDDAIKFQFLTVAYPYIGFTSLDTTGWCGIKTFTEPPPHDIVCGPDGVKAPNRIYHFTLLTQQPGVPLKSGALVALYTFSPGLVSLPLQQCCPGVESPHIVDCYVPATEEQLPPECWFSVVKVDAKAGEPISHKDLVMLQSKVYAKYCSVSVDGTFLCLSGAPSNATRNLFRLSLQKAKPAGSSTQGA